MVGNSKSRICVIFGTRPEAIKLLPLVIAAKSDPRFDCRICVTAQHRELLDTVLDGFGISVDRDLDLMQEDQSLGSLTSRAMAALDQYLEQHRPDLVLVQGDTTTSLCAALAAFYRKIPVGHVEAGLRTRNVESPWPEEANRVLISRLADLHFAPTETNRDHLLREDVPADRIFVTGNTVIDALRLALKQIEKNPAPMNGLPRDLLRSVNGNLILITAHRRENFGEHLRSICHAITEIAERFPAYQFVYPVHPNPNVQEMARKILVPAGLANIHLLQPLGYLPFVYLMTRSKLLLTDSGGIQEEAPYLGKPVLVMRDTTERPEGVATGTTRLIGTSAGEIVEAVSALLDGKNGDYTSMARRVAPFGDGMASGQILEACASFLDWDDSTPPG
ncbi:MAG: UDP-N-acetylglucosamine 2-epimerase (non-hydrolyzing) [Acidobacteria bacterium]|uniref:UDP-N-acetylglucosamine 2-epimerase (non-hydrolyzing) n=1 Tax=Candidatus Polarisedimenticola svalbardensis TaxID=2886004 RepID=A0A8J6XV68_9BACT|nr:UDP-N-acetylglucosamine 2-epimerase (non-hydrolyzing) [Candidatus Polarisedimenticola svalbardensis]